MKKIRTLLVDDHKIVRDGIRYILNSDNNIEVVGEAANGIEAIKYLEVHNDIDVILMDINMPQLNGIDATEIITKLYTKINILALTMHNEESYIVNMIRSGATGYVLKDTNSSNLLEAVKTVATGKNYYSNEVTATIINQLFQSSNSKQRNIELSERENEVIKYVVNGKTNRETAEIMCISPRTVETHRKNVLKKLDLKNTAELINYAYKNKIIN